MVANPPRFRDIFLTAKILCAFVLSKLANKYQKKFEQETWVKTNKTAHDRLMWAKLQQKYINAKEIQRAYLFEMFPNLCRPRLQVPHGSPVQVPVGTKKGHGNLKVKEANQYIYIIYKQIKISQHISTCHCLLQITKSVANSPNTCHVTSSCQIIGFTSSFGNFCSWLVVPNKVVSSDLIRSYNCLSIHKIAAVASTSNPGRSFLVYSVSIWIFWPNIPRPLHIPHTRSLRSLRQVAQDIGKTSRIEGIGAALQLATQGARDWGQQRPVLHLEHRSAGAIVLRRIRQLWRPSKCIKMWVCLKI